MMALHFTIIIHGKSNTVHRAYIESYDLTCAALRVITVFLVSLNLLLGLCK